MFRRKSLDELNGEKPLTDTFFELDSTDLSSESRASIQKDVDWMKRWSSTKVMVEGHADSRGTNEYNLALGERRADAVRDYMVSLGIPAERITIVSKGEEQPFCTEQTESCWQQNRRGHFIVTAK
jgi:peptidoglycan-associated lipoprotein